MTFYFCHQCQRRVHVTDNLQCETCQGEFVEEIDPNNDENLLTDDSQDTHDTSFVHHEEDDDESGGGAGHTLFVRRSPGGEIIINSRPISREARPRPTPFPNFNADNPLNMLLSQIFASQFPPTSSAASSGGGRPSVVRIGNTQPPFRASTSNLDDGIRVTGSDENADVGSEQSRGRATRADHGANGASLPPMFDFITQLLSNLSDAGEGNPAHFTLQINAPQMYGNFNDYAWGEAGLDNIVTQLLNQFEGTVVQNVSNEDLQRLPMTEVTEKQVENGTQCATCMEAFTMSERVARLDCQHIYHRPCIEPWLKKHNTCPICRHTVDPTKWATSSGGGAGTSSTPNEGPKITDIDELD